MKTVIYKCDFCNFKSEFLEQEIWEIKIPNGWGGKMHSYEEEKANPNKFKKPHKLYLQNKHVCLECGIKIYDYSMEMKSLVPSEEKI